MSADECTTCADACAFQSFYHFDGRPFLPSKPRNVICAVVRQRLRAQPVDAVQRGMPRQPAPKPSSKSFSQHQRSRTVEDDRRHAKPTTQKPKQSVSSAPQRSKQREQEDKYDRQPRKQQTRSSQKSKGASSRSHDPPRFQKSSYQKVASSRELARLKQRDQDSTEEEYSVSSSFSLPHDRRGLLMCASRPIAPG